MKVDNKISGIANSEIRILGRLMGEELSVEEIANVSGGAFTENENDDLLGTNTDTGTQCDK
jgi:hypothetical protein